MFTRKIWQVCLHIIGWLVFMALPLLFLNGGHQDTDLKALLRLPAYWYFNLIYIFLFYLNDLMLIPLFFLTKKYVSYFVCFLILGITTYQFRPYDNLLMNSRVLEMRVPGPIFGQPQPHSDKMPFPYPTMHGQMPKAGTPGHGNMIDSISLFLFLAIMGFSLAVRVIRQLQMTEQRAVQAEVDRTSAELSFLKAQINPHFLFNTLNNIYSLSVDKDEYTSESILRLSNIMRYVTDDAGNNLVPLEEEINCIHDYIALQKLRLNTGTSLDFRVNGDPKIQHIAPLILMTFVENVFKYGVSKYHKSLIRISVDITSDQISFFCQNRIFKQALEKRMGIGLSNTRKRLDHLYLGKHELLISQDNNLFTVNLNLFK